MRAGALVRQHRRAKSWSQGDLADALGVSQQLVSGWEREETIIFPAHIDGLVDVLGLDRVTLLEAILDSVVARTREQSADQGVLTTQARRIDKLARALNRMQQETEELRATIARIADVVMGDPADDAGRTSQH